MVDERGIGFVADRRDQRDDAVGGGADDDFLVEPPQILDAAAAAGDDDEIGARHGAALGQGVEAADGGGDLGGRSLRPGP